MVTDLMLQFFQSVVPCAAGPLFAYALVDYTPYYPAMDSQQGRLFSL